MSSIISCRSVSTRSRPKAAEWYFPFSIDAVAVSTRSRPKAADFRAVPKFKNPFSFNSQPPEGGWSASSSTASSNTTLDSTRSRPKAAGFCLNCVIYCFKSFNSQPPEGGWLCIACRQITSLRFQLAAARRRLVRQLLLGHRAGMFQLAAARRRLVHPKSSW